MTAWLPTSSRLKFDISRIFRPAFAEARERWRVAIRKAREIVSICSRGLAAAHHYQQLKSQSDADLAANGLQRGDVPKAVFQKLTEKS
jgi:hypothetical protein